MLQLFVFFSPTLSVGVIILLFAAILMFVPILQCAAVGCFSLIFPLENHNSLYNVSGIFYSNSSPSAPRERGQVVYIHQSLCVVMTSNRYRLSAHHKISNSFFFAPPRCIKEHSFGSIAQFGNRSHCGMKGIVRIKKT